MCWQVGQVTMSKTEIDVPFVCPHCGVASQTVNFDALVQSLPLSKVECQVLTCLWNNRGFYVSSGRVAQYLWGTHITLPLNFDTRNCIAQKIGRIRRKLPSYLCVHSRKTRGYRLEVRSNVGLSQ